MSNSHSKPLGNAKMSGDSHPPEVERDLPLQGNSDQGAQARSQEGVGGRVARKSGVLRDDEIVERAS